jgi:hypothetical protein
MPTMTKTKKPTKYHYFFEYNCPGDYDKVSSGLEKRYRKQFYGSGLNYGGGIPIGFTLQFYCTAKDYKRIVAYAESMYGDMAISRYTNKEFDGG